MSYNHLTHIHSICASACSNWEVVSSAPSCTRTSPSEDNSVCSSLSDVDTSLGSATSCRWLNVNVSIITSAASASCMWRFVVCNRSLCGVWARATYSRSVVPHVGRGRGSGLQLILGVELAGEQYMQLTMWILGTVPPRLWCPLAVRCRCVSP